MRKAIAAGDGFSSVGRLRLAEFLGRMTLAG
jgi:hypothetical protein